ncbi:MAG: hypothetical protein HAW60_05270 [Bdellovibrionales bacterium]|nr:hypothetical protein [Bdellovibrionales bacterium]
MSKHCPHCEASIEPPDNEFYITCKSCKKNISLDGFGNITEEEAEEEVVEEEVAVAAEEEVASDEAAVAAEEEVASDEAAPDEAKPNEAAPDEAKPDEATPNEESASHLEEAQTSSTDDQNLKSFSAEEMSADFNESCLYDLMISNIDSADMQSSLISILQDEKLQLDMDVILERFKNNISGKVSLKDLNVLKISYIVQNIYNSSIDVELYWQQKVSK